MSKAKFLRNVGSVSCSASIRGQLIGRYVSVSAYSEGADIVLKLENAGVPSRYFKSIVMTPERFDDLFDSAENGTQLTIKAIRMFGADPHL